MTRLGKRSHLKRRSAGRVLRQRVPQRRHKERHRLASGKMSAFADCPRKPLRGVANGELCAGGSIGGYETVSFQPLSHTRVRTPPNGAPQMGEVRVASDSARLMVCSARHQMCRRAWTITMAATERDELRNCTLSVSTPSSLRVTSNLFGKMVEQCGADALVHSRLSP